MKDNKKMSELQKDEELQSLEKRRDELFTKAIKLKDALAEIASRPKITKSIHQVHEIENLAQADEAYESSDDDIPLQKLVKITQNVTGITYNNVKKLWLKDKEAWLYKANVEIEILNFRLELTVKETDDFTEIDDITCHFDRVECYMIPEFRSWVESTTREKDFSRLMTVFSEYNSQCTLRSKILTKLEEKEFATIEKCYDKGGFLILIHSPNAEKKHLAEYQWTIQINPKTLALDHAFHIKPLDDEFVEQNDDLFRAFCKTGIKQSQIKDLWRKVCRLLDN